MSSTAFFTFFILGTARFCHVLRLRTQDAGQVAKTFAASPSSAIALCCREPLGPTQRQCMELSELFQTIVLFEADRSAVPELRTPREAHDLKQKEWRKQKRELTEARTAAEISTSGEGSRHGVEGRAKISGQARSKPLKNRGQGPADPKLKNALSSMEDHNYIEPPPDAPPARVLKRNAQNKESLSPSSCTRFRRGGKGSKRRKRLQNAAELLLLGDIKKAMNSQIDVPDSIIKVFPVITLPPKSSRKDASRDESCAKVGIAPHVARRSCRSHVKEPQTHRRGKRSIRGDDLSNSQNSNLKPPGCDDSSSRPRKIERRQRDVKNATAFTLEIEIPRLLKPGSKRLQSNIAASKKTKGNVYISTGSNGRVSQPQIEPPSLEEVDSKPS